MNPRRRRMLIPGLLVLLLVIVAVASLTKRADAAEPRPVSTLLDPRITESSGLAVSRTHADLAYTINDSGAEPLVFAVRISSGETVGVTRLTGARLTDPEALALHDGRLWIADTGDNNRQRSDAALLVIDEPGPGAHQVQPSRHPLGLKEPADIEALLIDPRDATMFLVSKTIGAGAVYRVAPPAPGEPATAQPTHLTAPMMVTDGAFAPDGRSIALVTYLGLQVLDPVDWQPRSTLALPPLAQPESLAFLDRGAVIVGSEGASSPLFELEVPEPAPPIAVAAFPPAALVLLLVAGRVEGA